MKGAAKEMGGIANKLIYLPTDGWVMGGNAPPGETGQWANGATGQQGRPQPEKPETKPQHNY